MKKRLAWLGNLLIIDLWGGCSALPGFRGETGVGLVARLERRTPLSTSRSAEMRAHKVVDGAAQALCGAITGRLVVHWENVNCPDCHELMTMSYQNMLRKYIKHVAECDGEEDYTATKWTKGGGFTEAEVAELQRLAGRL